MLKKLRQKNFIKKRFFYPGRSQYNMSPTAQMSVIILQIILYHGQVYLFVHGGEFCFGKHEAGLLYVHHFPFRHMLSCLRKHSPKFLLIISFIHTGIKIIDVNDFTCVVVNIMLQESAPAAFAEDIFRRCRRIVIPQNVTNIIFMFLLKFITKGLAPCISIIPYYVTLRQHQCKHFSKKE